MSYEAPAAMQPAGFWRRQDDTILRRISDSGGNKIVSDCARRIRSLAADGFCCSQILLQMGLDARQEENQELLDAVAGLCGGLHSGKVCGILTGAACLLSLFDKQKAASNMIPRLVDWFETAYSEFCGGIECDKIINGNPMNKLERCPRMMEETFEKCRELLAEIACEI
jgi:hypothetical protein